MSTPPLQQPSSSRACLLCRKLHRLLLAPSTGGSLSFCFTPSLPEPSLSSDHPPPRAPPSWPCRLCEPPYSPLLTSSSAGPTPPSSPQVPMPPSQEPRLTLALAAPGPPPPPSAAHQYAEWPGPGGPQQQRHQHAQGLRGCDVEPGSAAAHSACRCRARRLPPGGGPGSRRLWPSVAPRVNGPPDSVEQ